MPVFWRSDGDYPCVGQQNLTEGQCRRLSPSDLRTTLPDLCALAKRPLASAHRAERLASIRRRSAASLFVTPARAAIAFKQAHEKASQRRKEASDKPRKMTPDLVELVEEKLTQEQWSPDQISGRLAKDGVAFISHERIYQHVWKDKKDGVSCIFTCVTAAKDTTSGRARIRGAG